MSADLASLFNEFDRGRLSRRQLLKALGIAVGDSTGVRLRAGPMRRRSRRDTGMRSDARQAAVRADGLETVLLDHLSCQVADYPKEAAYYAALMNWKIRSDDGKQAVLDIGDWGGLVLRGGYQAPPPPPVADAPRLPAVVAAAAAASHRATRCLTASAGASSRGTRSRWRRNCKKRGLTPVADNDGKDFQSFHVKDPDGFDLQISNGSRKNRRQGAANGKTSAPAPFEATGLEDGVARSHLVRGLELQGDGRVLHGAPRLEAGHRRRQPESVPDRRRRRHHHPPRRRRQRAPAPTSTPPARRAAMGHISFGITPFDPDQVKAELEKRGLTARVDTGGRGDIHTSKL